MCVSIALHVRWRRCHISLRNAQSTQISWHGMHFHDILNFWMQLVGVLIWGAETNQLKKRLSVNQVAFSRGCCLTTMCRVVHSVLQQMLGVAVVWTGISLMVHTWRFPKRTASSPRHNQEHVWRWVYQNSVSNLCLMHHWMTLVRYQNCLESPNMVLAWIVVECFICLFILIVSFVIIFTYFCVDRLGSNLWGHPVPRYPSLRWRKKTSDLPRKLWIQIHGFLGTWMPWRHVTRPVSHSWVRWELRISLYDEAEQLFGSSCLCRWKIAGIKEFRWNTNCWTRGYLKT